MAKRYAVEPSVNEGDKPRSFAWLSHCSMCQPAVYELHWLPLRHRATSCKTVLCHKHTYWASKPKFFHQILILFSLQQLFKDKIQKLYAFTVLGYVYMETFLPKTFSDRFESKAFPCIYIKMRHWLENIHITTSKATTNRGCAATAIHINESWKSNQPLANSEAVECHVSWIAPPSGRFQHSSETYSYICMHKVRNHMEEQCEADSEDGAVRQFWH